jgi:hypothetical protein
MQAKLPRPVPASKNSSTNPENLNYPKLATSAWHKKPHHKHKIKEHLNLTSSISTKNQANKT